MRHRHKHIKNKLRHLLPKRWFFQRPLFWAGFLVVLLATGIFYLAFFFPEFQVQAIRVSGNEKVASQDIETLAWQGVNKTIWGIANKNIFMFDVRTLKDRITTGFPAIEELSIKKQWPGRLEISIVERVPFAIFCPNQNEARCFIIDKHGVIYEIAQAIGEDSFIVRQAVDEEKLVTGQTVVEKHIMGMVADVAENLQKNFQISLKEVLVSNPLVFTTAERWKIYFDPAEDADGQVLKMNRLLKNEITPEIRKNLQYIYLQYKDRAYYK